MAAGGQFNTKSPTIKRILKEASELASNASPDYHAEPLEDNLLEWHFTLKGPPSSPYEGGIYHGRIILPAQYPLRPPSFRFLTPTGRFEVNREICLSISGHHEETWQPAWGIRTAMVAIRSFMETDAKGQLGGIECTPQARKRMAGESGTFKCAVCGKTNAEIIREREEAAALNEVKEGKKKAETVPEELRLVYRDELSQATSSDTPEESTSKATGTESKSLPKPRPYARERSANAASGPSPAGGEARPNPTAPLPASRAPTTTQLTPQTRDEPSLAWIDACIYGIVAALLFLTVRKFA